MKQIINFFLAPAIFLVLILGCNSTKEPEWTKAKILFEKLENPSALTTDGKFLYFVTGGHLASLKAGTSGVWKIPVEGGQPTQLFKGSQIDENKILLPDTFVLATDEKYVYFAAGSIYRIPKEGGKEEQIAAGTPTELVLDEENIYWHNFVGEGMNATPVYSINKKGGEVKTLTEPATILDIAVDSEYFYWAQPNGIYKMSKRSGEKILVISPKKDKRIQGMITDQHSIYFLENDELFMIPKIGDAIIGITTGVNFVHKFFTDEQNIYFVKNEGTFGTSLNKVSKNGGAVTKIDEGYINSFTIGKDKIYASDVAKIYELSK